MIKTRGIVFQHIKYGETSLIAKIYTEALGLQSYIIRGARKRKSNTKANLLDHGTLVDLVAYHRKKSNLQNVKDINLAYSFNTIPFDISKSSVLIFMSEILSKCIREEEPNKKLFDFAYASIELLDQTDQSISNFPLYFMLHLAKHLGFAPRNNYSVSNRYFDMQAGAFVMMNPMHDNIIDPSLSGILSQIISGSITSQENLKISSEKRVFLLNRLTDYYKLHLPLFGDIKSHHVLHEVLQD